MNNPFTPLEFTRLSHGEQQRRLRAFRDRMATRRSVRDFSPDPVPFDLIETALRTAGLAPSGANLQPWHFIVVSNPEIKRRIRLAAEEEERENYGHRFPDAWKTDLEPFGTDWHKPFLETAPHLIVVFQILYDEQSTPQETAFRKKHYYVTESVGIAVGFLIAALHHAGLVTLPHTPSPMGFLNSILGRPKNERPFVLLPVGFPAPDARVPVITKKGLDEIMIHLA